MKRVFRFIWALIKYIFVGRTVSNEIYHKRLDVCFSCKELIKSNNSCGICGCYVKQKAKWSTENCPKNKW